jgi:hypothetical protein
MIVAITENGTPASSMRVQPVALSKFTAGREPGRRL